jgi:hypothetical protein
MATAPVKPKKARSKTKLTDGASHYRFASLQNSIQFKIKIDKAKSAHGRTAIQSALQPGNIVDSLLPLLVIPG